MVERFASLHAKFVFAFGENSTFFIIYYLLSIH